MLSWIVPFVLTVSFVLSSTRRAVTETNCFYVETNFIAAMGPNSDGFGGVQIFCFHFFLVSVPTKKLSSKSRSDVQSRLRDVTSSPDASMRRTIFCFICNLSSLDQLSSSHVVSRRLAAKLHGKFSANASNRSVARRNSRGRLCTHRILSFPWPPQWQEHLQHNIFVGMTAISEQYTLLFVDAGISDDKWMPTSPWWTINFAVLFSNDFVLLSKACQMQLISNGYPESMRQLAAKCIIIDGSAA